MHSPSARLGRCDAPNRPRAWPALPALALLLLAGCSLAGRGGRSGAPVGPGSPAARALAFLEATQVSPEEERRDGERWAGGWPVTLYGASGPLGLRWGDVEPGSIWVVLRALARLWLERPADVTDDDVDRARRIALRAAETLRRFEVPDAATGARAVGWWPLPRERRPRPLVRLAARAMERIIGGPRLQGTLAPWNLPELPCALRMWPDLDSTALNFIALDDVARVEGRRADPDSLVRLAVSARDLAPRTLRSPAWLPRPGGAFLTWLVPAHAVHVRNDVELGVNANVLRALARAGRLDTPGVAEATSLLLDAVSAGRHRDLEQASPYYAVVGTLALAVASAWREGPVPALEPAARRLADELAASADRLPHGRARWGDESPTISTAAAVLALRLVRGDDPLAEAGRRWLLDHQDPCDGGWPAETFTWARSDTGWRADWRSRAASTAMALRALTR